MSGEIFQQRGGAVARLDRARIRQGVILSAG